LIFWKKKKMGSEGTTPLFLPLNKHSIQTERSKLPNYLDKVRAANTPFDKKDN
jgi:hypothetical protein